MFDRVSCQALIDDVGGPCADLPVDLRSDDALDKAFTAAVDAHGPVSILINCAGIMDVHAIGDTDWHRAETMLRVNFWSPMRLMWLAVPHMRTQGEGGIINLASIAGFSPLRGGGWYCGTKAGLAMASECAHMELSAQGVHVLTVYPGPIETPLKTRAFAQVEPNRYDSMLPTASATQLAERIVASWKAGQRRLIHPGLYRLGWMFPPLVRTLADRFSPQPLHPDSSPPPLRDER